jgi:hypothetical protein
MTIGLEKPLQWRRCLAAAFLALASLLFPRASLAYTAPPDEATKQAIDMTLDAAQSAGMPVPGDKDTRDMLTSVLTCGIRGDKLINCARDALVDKLPDEAKPLGKCLLEGGRVEECAAKGFIGFAEQQIQDPTLQKAAQCVTDKLGSGDQAGAAQCLLDPAAKEAAKHLPPDLQKCFDSPEAGGKCAMDKLGPLSKTAECIAKVADPTGCDSTEKGLADALGTLKKLVPDDAVDPSKAPKTLGNLLKVAQGIRSGKWDDVVLYGGSQIYLAASHIVVEKLLPELVPGVGAILAYLSGPILDTIVQDRVDLIQQLWDQLKACEAARNGNGRCDVPKIGEILGQFYMIMQIEIPCALLKESILPAGLSEAVCGPAVKFIGDVAGAGLDFYENNTKAIAAAAAVYINPIVGAAVLATDPDVQNFIIGKEGDCPANYFVAKMAVCYKRAAFLSFDSPAGASQFRSDIEAACHAAFKKCSMRRVDVFDGKNDSDRINDHCNPLMTAYDQGLAAVTDGILKIANAEAAAGYKDQPDVCAPDYAIDQSVERYAPQCAQALRSKLPDLDSPNWQHCAFPDPSPDALLAACRVAAKQIATAKRADFTRSLPSGDLGAYCKHRDSCNAYAFYAARDAKDNIDQHCGGAGSRWTTDYAEHKRWCLTVDDAATQSEEAARKDFLSSCGACNDYLQHVQKLLFTNSFDNCGLTGPLWSTNPADHIQYCQTHSPADMERQQGARKAALDSCIAKNSPPEVLCVKRPFNERCAPGTGETSTGPICGCPQNYHPEDRTGAGIFDTCVPNDDVTLPCSPPSQPGAPPQCFGGKILVAAGVAPPGICACPPGAMFNGISCSGAAVPPATLPVLTPPVQPGGRPQGQAGQTSDGTACTGGMILIAGKCQCPAGTQFNGRICSSGGVTGTECPAGQHRDANGACFSCAPNRVFVMGQCVACKNGTHVEGGQCVPDKASTTGTGNGGTNGTHAGGVNQGPCPQPDQHRDANGICFSCSHNDHFENGRCVPNSGAQRCPKGTHLENGVCVTTTAQAPCEPGQQRDPKSGVCFSCSHNDHFENGRCVPNTGARECRKGTHVENGVCVPDITQTSQKCPPGTELKNGKCVKPGKCPLGQLGTPPNCKCPLGETGTPPNCCPPGTQFKNGKCVKPQTTTTHPKHDCPPGYKVLDKPNKYGAYCEAPVATSCPAGWTGKPPACKPPPKQQTQPTPVGPAPKHCQQLRVCDKYGTSQSGGIAGGPCLHYHFEQVCGDAKSPR